MTFKSYLAEEKLPTKFEDSLEATEFFDDILARLKSKAVAQWVKATDDNYDVSATAKLKAVITAFEKFQEELDDAA